jgi:hypothetical protein
LREPSVVLVFQMRAVSRRLIGGRIGAVSASGLAQIHAALDKLMGR